MPLLDVIYDFATGANEPTPRQYTITRTTEEIYGMNGFSTPGTSSTFLITACVQPIDGRNARIVVDANVTIETRKLYTDTKLLPRTPGFAPDQITIDGEVWTVHRCKRWEYYDDVFFVVDLTRNLNVAQPDAAG